MLSPTTGPNDPQRTHTMLERLGHAANKRFILHSQNVGYRRVTRFTLANKVFIVGVGLVIEKALPLVQVPGLDWTLTAQAIATVIVVAVMCIALILSLLFSLAQYQRVGRLADRRENEEDGRYYR